MEVQSFCGRKEVLPDAASCKIVMVIGYLLLICLQISFLLFFAIIQHIKVFIPFPVKLFAGLSRFLCGKFLDLIEACCASVSSKIFRRSSSDSFAVFLRVPALVCR